MGSIAAMAGITPEQAQTQLNLYLEAEAKVLLGQAYTIGGRSLTRADLAAIQAGVKVWQERAAALGMVAGRARTIVPAG